MRLQAGKDRFGPFLMIGDWRAAMPNAEVAARLARVCRLEEALDGMVSIETSVTQGQEKERREKWLPVAKALIQERAVDAYKATRP